MASSQRFTGYKPGFIGRRRSLRVALPEFSEEFKNRLAPVKKREDCVLRYKNYSVIQEKERKFPILTASNIHGKLLKSIPRKSLFKSGDRWVKDRRISYQHQWGSELYSAPFSDFDKGHMVKREDVQWGRSATSAKEGARSTFFYTNAVPQHKDLNRSIWRRIEDYVLHSETHEFDLKINVFTGPVLRDDDPLFVSRVRNQQIRIPTLFWKVIYYTRDRENLCRVAFLVGQHTLLEENEITEPKIIDRSGDQQNYFLDFDKADTYQVNPPFIETLVGFQLPPAIDLYQDERATKLILQEVNVRGEDDPLIIIEGLVF